MVRAMRERPRLLVVDDEEAILETMTFTFEGEYEVLTASSPSRALELLAARGPVAVVLSDQRMPEMTGVEFLTTVFKRYPDTVRMILTGFADMDAIIHAINDGHVYAYITKPWEPDQLRQVVRRAVEHHELAVLNERLLRDLRASNLFLENVMDQLDTGALAVDADDVVRAINRRSREYLGLGDGDVRGQRLEDVLPSQIHARVTAALAVVRETERHNYEEIELPVAGGVKLRISMHTLTHEGAEMGQVILAKEISHEPLRRRFEELVEGLLLTSEEKLRARLVEMQTRLQALSNESRQAGVASPGMGELRDRVSRALTALEYWLAVDDALAGEDFPDAGTVDGAHAHRIRTLAARRARAGAGERTRAPRGELLRVRRKPKTTRLMIPVLRAACRASNSESKGCARVIASASRFTRAKFVSSARARAAARAMFSKTCSPKLFRFTPSVTTRRSCICASTICGATRSACTRRPAGATPKS